MTDKEKSISVLCDAAEEILTRWNSWEGYGDKDQRFEGRYLRTVAMSLAAEVLRVHGRRP